MPTPTSDTHGNSRRITRETGTFTRLTPGSHSLERGIGLLRCFLEGVPYLSNADLAARTQLPKATISRLTHSLVKTGLLEFDPQTEGYRLAPACLSLGRAFQFSRSEVNPINDLLRQFAKENNVNMSLSLPDQIHMVYISTFRDAQERQPRSIVPGGRLLMPSSSPGIAYLCSRDGPEQEHLFTQFEQHYGAEWKNVKDALLKAMQAAKSCGYSYAESKYDTIGVGVTAKAPNGYTYAINASFSRLSDWAAPSNNADLGNRLLQLLKNIESMWEDDC